MAKLKLPAGFQQKLKTFQNSSRKEHLFYYEEKHALATKKILESLHESGLPIRIRPTKQSLSTLRQQYYHGAYFLLDNLDPNGIYKRFFDRTRASIASGEYLEFTIKPCADNISPLEDIEVVTPWKEEFMLFLDNAGPNAKFYKPGVSLSQQDLIWINNQLVSLVKPNGDPLFFGEIEIGKPLLLIRDED